MNGLLTKTARGLPETVPFVGPETQERGRGASFKARIGANENAFGPSPLTVRAIRSAAAGAWMYGDPENHDLRHALAAHHGVSADNIVVGEGIDGLFGYVARLFVEPGVVVVTSQGAYPTFNYQIAGSGGRIVTVPYKNDREDPDALLELVRGEGARLVYLANPDNPMGTWWSAAEVQVLVDGIPDGCLLCLDEAYGEFGPAGTQPDLDVSNDRVLRFRTFSKAYGLAGCRIGYAVGEAGLIRSFNKVRNHFGVNRLAQAAALAALADQEYLSGVVAKVAAGRRHIAEIAAANGLKSLPSAANFVAVDCGRDGGYAAVVLEGLLQRDVFVRMPGVAPLNRCIRVSVGRPEDLELFARALPDALSHAAGPGR